MEPTSGIDLDGKLHLGTYLEGNLRVGQTLRETYVWEHGTYVWDRLGGEPTSGNIDLCLGQTWRGSYFWGRLGGEPTSGNMEPTSGIDLEGNLRVGQTEGNLCLGTDLEGNLHLGTSTYVWDRLGGDPTSGADLEGSLLLGTWNQRLG
ncbi:hypothetical protein NHX12_007801 [Muraenolepis orangiensis]|uniref:Uncharacterized protein n=1 Tax=Muraenolepis orangiensis TaxID=630683 RepID=A0A9Q0IBL8_9TELE|nr:hypothetical protein NHX12_007801 [Muraenolepis orangiensis]